MPVCAVGGRALQPSAIMATTPEMALYSVTLEQPSAISTCVVGKLARRSPRGISSDVISSYMQHHRPARAICPPCRPFLTDVRLLCVWVGVLATAGNFSAPRSGEIAVSRGRVIELLRPDAAGRLRSVCVTDVFGLVRSMSPFRLQGSSRDYLVVGSDSGRIVVLQFNPERGAWDKVQQETYGKTGCRRIVPGEYLAVDPRGRAVLIGAVEKQKLVYVLNRDDKARLAIASPLEAHKGHTICFDVVGVDVGFENPIFACLEVDYADADVDPTGEAAAETPKLLTYYELDLGLNNVTRRWSEETERSANLLMPVPGGSDGPSGVLVCSENWITYKHEGATDVRTPLPRRFSMPDSRGLLITSFTMHKQRGLFFFLAQSELGDLYKVSLDYTEDLVVTNVHVQYFDTVAPANDLAIVVHNKAGYLFAASEFSNHGFYQFLQLGDEGGVRASAVTAAEGEAVAVPMFNPRPLTNLGLVDELTSLSPVTGLHISDLAGDGTPQLYTLCGRGTRSSLRVLRHGLPVSEIAVADLPSAPAAVFTVKGALGDPNDRFIVVSYTNATQTLSIGETVEEVEDSGLKNDARTLALTLLADGSTVQVHTGAIRLVTESGADPTEWTGSTGSIVIVAAATNTRQIAIAQRDHIISYFEYDDSAGLPRDPEEVQLSDTAAEVVALDLAPVPEGSLRCPYLAVALADQTVRLLSLEPHNLMEMVALQVLSAPASSVCLAPMSVGAGLDTSMFLCVGLENGVFMRTRVDDVSGELSDTRTRFLGVRPVSLERVQVAGSTAVLALSARPWLCYGYAGRFHTTPLSYSALQHGANFCSEVCPEGVVGIANDQLCVISVDRQGGLFNESVVPLTYTPRRMCVHPASGYVITVETDHDSFNMAERAAALEAAGDVPASSAGAGGAGGEYEEEEETPEARLSRVGAPLPPAPGKWASCVRILSPTTGETLYCADLEDNEAAFSVTTCVFHDRGGEVFLLVGTAKDMSLHPRKVGEGFIRVYRFVETDSTVDLVLLHKTAVEDVPYAMCEFNGRVLIGVGSVLRIYDMGKKKLLKKCENRTLPTFISGIKTMGDRIFVSDMAESMHFVKYKRGDNVLVVFADDSTPRHVVASVILDKNTVACGDKFGNIAILRLPSDVSDDVNNPSSKRLMWEQGFLNGAPNKLNTLCMFYVGEVVTAMEKTSLPGGAECILYTTVMGTIGALLPVGSREEFEFFAHLEVLMRKEAPSLVGRDHMSFRSYFLPVKNVLDGDLCERFAALSHEQQTEIAEALSRKPGEVLKKLEDVRNKII